MPVEKGHYFPVFQSEAAYRRNIVPLNRWKNGGEDAMDNIRTLVICAVADI